MDSTKKINSRDKVNIYGIMVHFIKVIINKDLDKVLENGNQADKITISTSVIFGEIKSKEQENIFGVINVSIRVISSMILSINLNI